MNPLVSVVVTTYNQAPYIQQALQSVFDQTYPNFEVIVVDDGSTDDTPTKLGPFMDRIVYVRQENPGVAASRNAGIQKAKGEFIALLDGDDLWELGKLAIQVEALRRFPSAGLIAVNGIEFDEHGVIGTSLFDREFLDRLDSSTESDHQFKYLPESCYRLFLVGNRIWTVSQVMIPRCVLERVGPSDSSLPIASDYDLYLRILKNYRMAAVDKSLTRWRYLPSSASGPRELRPLRWWDDEIRVLIKHLTVANAEDRDLVANQIRMWSICLVRGLYHYGLNDLQSKTWASWRLIGLLQRKRVPAAIVIAYLGALWVPQKWAITLRPYITKALRTLATDR